MKLLSWKSVNREAMSPLLTRQHLSCEKMTLARVELKKGCYVPSHQHENEQHEDRAGDSQPEPDPFAAGIGRRRPTESAAG